MAPPSSESRLHPRGATDAINVPLVDDEQALDPAWLRAHPLRWRTWLDGYAVGVEHGFGRGADWANDGWTLATAAACRAGLSFIDAAERQQRRREPGHLLRCRVGPVEAHRRCAGCYRPQSAEEIHAQAVASWAAVEEHAARRVAS